MKMVFKKFRRLAEDRSSSGHGPSRTVPSAVHALAAVPVAITPVLGKQNAAHVDLILELPLVLYFCSFCLNIYHLINLGVFAFE
jgi:hypothetical protein